MITLPIKTVTECPHTERETVLWIPVDTSIKNVFLVNEYTTLLPADNLFQTKYHSNTVFLDTYRGICICTYVYGNILVFRDIIPCKNYGFGHMSWKCLFIYGYATWKYHVFLDMYHGNKYHVFQDVPW